MSGPHPKRAEPSQRRKREKLPDEPAQPAQRQTPALARHKARPGPGPEEPVRAASTNAKQNCGAAGTPPPSHRGRKSKSIETRWATVDSTRRGGHQNWQPTTPSDSAKAPAGNQRDPSPPPDRASVANATSAQTEAERGEIRRIKPTYLRGRLSEIHPPPPKRYGGSIMVRLVGAPATSPPEEILPTT